MSKIHYQQIDGDSAKPVIICLHTAPLDSSYLLTSLTNFKPTNPVIAIDLPGHGQSPDEDKLTFEQMADRVEGLRQDLSLDRIIMYGHGIGGFVVQHYAIKYQKHLTGLIISNSAPNTKYREFMAWNIRDRYTKMTRQAIEDYYGKTDDQSIRMRFTRSLAVHFQPTNHERAKKIMDDCHRIASELYVHLSQNEIPKHDVREQLRKIKVKTLIMSNKEDVWPTNASLLIKNDINHATLLVQDGGHFHMLENPQEYWNAIDTWINGS
jgi:proline-specific peptidase